MWNSMAAMTIFDLVIIGMILVALLALHKGRQSVRRLGLILSVDVIYFALLLIGLFYISDLLIMHVLPLITSHAYAMRIMGELHLNWSWVVFLIVVSVITVGFTHLVRSVVPKVVSAITEREQAEEELSRIRDELEVRVQERTRALQVEITERKRAEEALAERARRFEGLIRTSARVAESIEKTEDTLSGIAEEAANLLEVEGAGFRLLEETRLVVAGNYGLAQQVMLKPSIEVGESLTGLVAQEGRTIAVADLQKDERLHPEHKQAAISHGIVAFLGVPLRYRDRIVGVLNVYGAKRHTFDDEEVSLLRVFADHAAIAIEKARLYGEAKRHAEALRKEITERKQAVEVLRRYEHIVSASGDLMAFIDTEYRYRAVNVAYVEAFGKSREELIGQSVAVILGTEVFATRLKPHLDECLSGKRVNFQHWLELPGRGRCYLDVHYDPFSDAHGSVTGVVVNVRDVTEARNLSEQLELLNRQNELLLNSAGEGIYGLDMEGKTTFVNPAAARMIGWELEELIGKPQHDILHHTKPDGSPYPRQQCPICAAFKDGAVHHVDNEVFWRKDGTSFPVEYIRTPIREQSGLIGAVVSFRDITERKQAEEALKSSEERFRNLVEGSIQGVFIHRDFKPLFVNRAFADILGYDSTDELLASIESIVELHAPHERDRIRGYEEARLRGEDAPVQYEYDVLCKDGTIVTLQNFVRVINWKGELATQSTVIDISEARSLSEQLSYQASHDVLTGLLNRRAFEQRLQQLLETAKTGRTEHVLCYLDLDQFKVINDSCGHTAGDELLRQLGNVLQQRIRGRDTFARLGGDEFGILLERCSIKQALRVTTIIQKEVEGFRFTWEEQRFSIGVSIGVVSINEASENMARVLSKADAACYVAKDAGRNRVHIYHEDDVELAKRHGEMHWVAVINRALEENRFYLVLQPIMSLAKGQVDAEHYELLIRMQDGHGHVVAPDAFLPAAERYNLSTKVDRWVIDAAFQWLTNHPQQLKRIMLCAINLSGCSLGDTGFLEFVIQQFAEHNLPPHKICFEVTETAAIANLTHATNFITALRKLGCRFALDDFGSGQSSFAYLKNLPVDFIKIDGMFVKDIVDDPIDLAMVKSINDMGHVMGKQTIAEFVENDAILEKLREIGVDYAQGYGIGRPRPLKEMTMGPQAELTTRSARIASRAGRDDRKTQSP